MTLNDYSKEWQDTPEYHKAVRLDWISERYFAYNDGSIFDSKRKFKLKFSLDKDGYYLYNTTINAKRINLKIHRVIAQAFIPNPENKPQVNHINGIKTDNRVENLEWATAKENITHSFKNGLSSQVGERNARSKFTKEQIIEIKNKMLIGIANKDLCKEYNMSNSNMAAIKIGRRWNHIKV